MTEALSGPGFRKIVGQLGSETFLEPRSLAVLVLPLMFVTSVTTANTDDPRHLGAWLLANLIALLPITALVLMTRHIWLTKAPNFLFPLPLTFAIAATIGWFKALLTGLAAVSLSDLEIADINLGNRLWGGVLSGMVTLLMASLALLLLREFQAQRTLLLTAKAMQAMPALTSVETKRLKQLSEGVAEILRDLRTGAREAPKMEAKVLRELVERYVRPLSSSLFTQIERNYQSFALGELLRSAVRNQPPALAMGLVFLISTPRNIEWLGLQTGLLLSIAGALFIFLTTYALGAFFRALDLSGFSSYIFSSLAGTVGVVMALVALLEPGLQVSSTIIFALTVWSTQNALVFGMAKVAIKSAASNRREFSDLVQNTDPDASFALLLRNRKLMANQMHGEVQSRFMNLVLSCESGEELESNVVIAELASIQRLLENVKPEPDSLESSLNKLVALWSSIARIEINLTKPTADRLDQSMLLAVVEEGVSNAIRHGLADHVTVTLEVNGRLVIEDNGMGPKDGAKGLGAKLFLAGSNSWSLNSREQGGSRLELNLRFLNFSAS